VRVAIVDRQRSGRHAAGALRSFVARLCEVAPPGRATCVSVLLCGDGTIRRLNRDYRGRDRPTDVLSFPADGSRRPDGEIPLGDVAISVPRAVLQARAAGHSLAREVRLLAIHGYLHLLGYDHEVDDGRMARRERRLVGALVP
jgi:probable rRNA maturation factor